MSLLQHVRRNVLENYLSDGLDDIGPIKWSLALCVFAVFILVYFSLWKGVRSTGKVITFYSTRLKRFDMMRVLHAGIIGTSTTTTIRVFDLIGLLKLFFFPDFSCTCYCIDPPSGASFFLCFPSASWTIYRFNLSVATSSPTKLIWQSVLFFLDCFR